MHDDQCEVVLESMPQADISMNYEDLIVRAKSCVEDFIVHCTYAGKPCGNIMDAFEPVNINLQMCYTFNSRRVSPPEQSKATGRRQGLELMLNVNQSEYALGADAVSAPCST